MIPVPHPIPLACVPALDLLQRWLDGDAPDLPPAIEEHLEICHDCRERFQAVPDLLDALARLDLPQPPALLSERLVVAVQRDGQRRQRWQRWRRVGTLAAAVLVAVWLTRPRPDTPASAPASLVVVQVEAQPELPTLQRGVAEAREALVALTQRAAREAVGDGLELPEVLVSAEPGSGQESADAPWAAARQGLAEGFEPVVSSARRAVRLFLRDLPLESKD